MRTFILSIVFALMSSACASNLAEVQDEGLAEEQEMLEGNADDLEEDEQEVNVQGLDNEESLENLQQEGEDQQIQNEDQQMLDENQQFSERRPAIARRKSAVSERRPTNSESKSADAG